MTRKVLAQMDPLTRIRELLHPVDATYSAEPIDIDDARWLLAQLDLKSDPEGERRPSTGYTRNTCPDPDCAICNNPDYAGWTTEQMYRRHQEAEGERRPPTDEAK